MWVINRQPYFSLYIESSRWGSTDLNQTERKFWAYPYYPRRNQNARVSFQGWSLHRKLTFSVWSHQYFGKEHVPQPLRVLHAVGIAKNCFFCEVGSLAEMCHAVCILRSPIDILLANEVNIFTVGSVKKKLLVDFAVLRARPLFQLFFFSAQFKRNVKNERISSPDRFHHLPLRIRCTLKCQKFRSRFPLPTR